MQNGISGSLDSDEQQAQYISPYDAMSLYGLLAERVSKTPDCIAYWYYDTPSVENERNSDSGQVSSGQPATDNGTWRSVTWSQVSELVCLWRAALAAEGLSQGDRVAIMLTNRLEWMLFDMAALSLGLVVVPLYVTDRPDNLAYILNETSTRLLFVEGLPQWERIELVGESLVSLQRIVALNPVCTDDCDTRIRDLGVWLAPENSSVEPVNVQPADLATIVFTSGTTGKPKGVMLTHENILANCQSGLSAVTVQSTDTFLSFLPLSHMFERTVGYYIPIMAGAIVAYARSIKLLGKDMEARQPTVLVTVPRIFERMHARLQASLQEKGRISRWLFNLTVYVGWQRFEREQGRRKNAWFNCLWPILDKIVASKVRSRLGGRIRIAVSGGAPLSPEIARMVIGMGITLLQGYGLTETSPVLTVNRPEDNLPRSVGRALPNVEIRLSDDNEVLARGVNIMPGYWKNPEATTAVLDQDGWLHTGDKGYFDEKRRLYISGRIKDILVLSNGEKVPPEDLEMAIALDPLFDLVLVAGEQRPFLTVIVVLNPTGWEELAVQLNLDPKDMSNLSSEYLNDVLLQRIGGSMAAFPGYAQVRQVIPTLTPWGIDDGLITPTMKVRRKKVLELFHDQLENVYKYKGKRSVG